MMTPAELAAHQIKLIGAQLELDQLGPQTTYVLNEMHGFMAEAQVLAAADVGLLRSPATRQLLDEKLAELRAYVEKACTELPWGPEARAELGEASRLVWREAIAEDADGRHELADATLERIDRLVDDKLELFRALAEGLPKVAAAFEHDVRAGVERGIELRARIEARRRDRRAGIAGPAWDGPEAVARYKSGASMPPVSDDPAVTEWIDALLAEADLVPGLMKLLLPDEAELPSELKRRLEEAVAWFERQRDAWEEQEGL